MDKYIPHYDITEEMLGLTAEITELLGELKNVNDLEKLPRLRRVGRIKSIHSSLAIENNTLTLKQVTDVIDGKRVLGPEDDIIAVKNAFETYKTLDNIDPFSIKDLKNAHEIMMKGLVEEFVAQKTAPVFTIKTGAVAFTLSKPPRVRRQKA